MNPEANPEIKKNAAVRGVFHVRGVQNEKGRFRRKPAFSFPLFRSGALLPLTQAPLTGAASDRKDDEPLRVGPSIGVNYTQVLATCRAKFTNCRQFKTRDAKSLGFSENGAGKARVLQEKIICRPFGRRIASTAALLCRGGRAGLRELAACTMSARARDINDGRHGEEEIACRRCRKRRRPPRAMQRERPERGVRSL